MKSFKMIALLLLILLAVSPVFGQLSISLQLNRSTYMVYEQIYACVRIRNDSGRPLLFGDRPELQGFLLFDIRDQNNRLIQRIPGMEIPVKGMFIAPGETKNVVIPLHRFYNLHRPGNYRIYAYVSHNRLRNEFRSREALIRVSAGSVVWSKTVGLPSTSDDDDAPVIERTYSVVKLSCGSDKYYYLRVEDDGRVYAVCRIGQVLAHAQYEVQVDMLSRIHLLMPIGPRVYHYMAFNTDGMLIENSYWKTSGTVPMLHRDTQTGVVTRMGGVAARKGVDYTDPAEAGVPVSEMIGGGSRDQQQPPAPRVDSGVVDLGADVLPTKPDDED